MSGRASNLASKLPGWTLGLAIVLAGTSVGATGVRLSYVPEHCGDEAMLRAGVERELHRDPFGEPARYTVTATVRRAAGRLQARIELHDDHGTRLGARELEARDCEELVPAMSWVIALAVEPLTRPPALPPPPLEAVPVAAPVSVPAPAPALEVAPARPPPIPRRRFGFRVGLGVLGAIDAGAAPTAGFAVSVSALRPRYSLGLEVRGDMPASASARFGGTVSTTQAMLLVVPCARHKVASVCALGALGLEHGSGSGYAQPGVAWAPYLALGGRVAVELPLHHLLWLRLHADLLAALTHLELYVGRTDDPSRRVYRTPTLSNAFGAALLIELP